MYALQVEGVRCLRCPRSASATREHLLRDLKQHMEQLQLPQATPALHECESGERKRWDMGQTRASAMSNTMVRTSARIPRGLGDSLSRSTRASITITLQLTPTVGGVACTRASAAGRPGPKVSLRGFQCVVRVGVRAEQVHTVWSGEGTLQVSIT